MKNSSSGFALFEVMVTVFIVSFGVLGLAAMQYKTFSLTRDADSRSIVALHSEGLAEAMRANPIRSLDAGGAMQWSLNHYLETNPVSGTVTAPEKNCAGSPCSQQELARYDLYIFHHQLKNSFPASGTIISRVCRSTSFASAPTFSDLGCSDSNSDPVVVKVAWKSKANKNEASAASSTQENSIEYGYQLKVEP